MKIPVPKDKSYRESLIKSVKGALEARVKEKAFIKQCPMLIEESLHSGQVDNIDNFLEKNLEQLQDVLVQDTIRAEFGKFEAFKISSAEIKESVLLPKYYDPSIEEELKNLSENCDLYSLGKLKSEEHINYYTGDEIGKMAYGTGEIPFFRTSDFANWELKHNPKQGISEDIYEIYTVKKQVEIDDIFLDRDGT